MLVFQPLPSSYFKVHVCFYLSRFPPFYQDTSHTKLWLTLAMSFALGHPYEDTVF